MNKNDLRYIKTEKLIIETFLNCVEEVGFENASVSMICEKALISRNTFYVHYEDKYTLLNSIYDQFEKAVSKDCDEKVLADIKKGHYVDSVRWMISFISKNRNTVRILMKSSRQDFYNLIERVFVDKPMSALDKSYYEKGKTLEAKLSKAYMIHATIGFFEVWVNQGENYSTEDAYKLFKKLCDPTFYCGTVLENTSFIR